jgi:two-component system, cell cycle sensor histidine kinase and response regulator CckA
MRHPLPFRLTPTRLALVYVLLSAAWVLVSSELVFVEFQSAQAITAWEIIKGLCFILASGGLIFWLARRLLQRLLRAEEALRISEAQRSLLETRLTQAGKLEALGQLAAGLVHDFNNVLEIIFTGLYLLQARNPDEEERRSLQSMSDAARRISALTRQLLLFARPQAEELQLISLNAVVTETVELLKPALGKRIAVMLTLEPKLERLRADSRQISQVLINLCLNARDAMKTGGTLEIRTENIVPGPARSNPLPDLAPGAYVCLAVSDTGRGIPPEIRDKIFEPFFTTKEKTTGTGLGLFMVQGIVKKLGGSVEVSSTPSQGAIFSVYLPCNRAQAISQGYGTELIV